MANRQDSQPNGVTYVPPGYSVFRSPLCGGYGVREYCPQEYSAGALENFPPCGDCPPVTPRKPKWVKIQQGPRLICKRRYVNVAQKIYEPELVPITKEVDVPHVTICARPARIPKISYKIQVIKEPTLIYEPKEWTGPVLINKPKITCEPQEVCTTFICRPKPQFIFVPPPDEYCCDPQGIVTTPPNLPCPPCLFGDGYITPNGINGGGIGGGSGGIGGGIGGMGGGIGQDPNCPIINQGHIPRDPCIQQNGMGSCRPYNMQHSMI